MKSIEWIDRLKADKGIESDYKIAMVLGLTRGAISQHRVGKVTTLDDKTAFRIETELKLPHGEVIFDQHAEREKDPTLSKMWEELKTIVDINKMVPRGRIELPTQGFSILCSTD